MVVGLGQRGADKNLANPNGMTGGPSVGVEYSLRIPSDCFLTAFRLGNELFAATLCGTNDGERGGPNVGETGASLRLAEAFPAVSSSSSSLSAVSLSGRYEARGAATGAVADGRESLGGAGGFDEDATLGFLSNETLVRVLPDLRRIPDDRLPSFESCDDWMLETTARLSRERSLQLEVLRCSSPCRRELLPSAELRG